MRTYGSVRYHAPRDAELFALGTWVLTTEPHVTMRLKRIFGRINPRQDGSLWLSDTPETAADLEWVMHRWPLEADDLTRTRLMHRVSEYREGQEAVDLVLGGEHLPFDLVPGREPREYQLQAADLALTTGRLLLGDDVGLGKTFSGLLVLRHPEALPALVVCPTHLTRQWLGELSLAFPMLRGHIVRKTTVYDIARTRQMRGFHPDVLIMSYSKLAGWSQHLTGKVRTVIFDEAQELRVGSSLKYTAAVQVADAARFKLGMTATPVYNYGGEIFNVMRVLDRDALGSHGEFLQEWGTPMSNGRTAVKDPRALGSFLREENLMLRRTRAEVGRELGDLIRVPHTVDADADVFERETAEIFDLASMIIDGSGSREERFKASGELDWQMRRATGLAKAPYVAAFVNMLLESEGKVLLFGWHRDVYEVWRDALAAAGVGWTMYTGSESVAGKQRARDRFISDEECRVFIMSLRSGAGLDGLQEACRVAVFGELDWSPAMHDQCLGRLHRDGQDDPVVGYFLTCDYGSDPTVMETLGVKRGQAEPLRDPTVQLFEQMETKGDRVKQLAKAVLAKRRKVAA